MHQFKMEEWLCGPGSGRSSVGCGRTHRYSQQNFRPYRYMALCHISVVNSLKQFIICTDSLSALQAISKNYIEHHSAGKVVEIIISLNSRIKLMWVPSQSPAAALPGHHW